MVAISQSADTLRRTLAWTGLGILALAIACLAGRFADTSFLGLADYIAYWSAGHQNAIGANPYSPEALLALQEELGWAEDFPNMMYYPPWTLPLVMPFGIVPYGISRLLWLFFHLGILLCCAERIWRFYNGPPETQLWVWIATLSFVPSLIVLKMGQIGPLLLLGLVGFLYFEKRGLDWAAGAALLLLAIKPQLVYLFGLATVVWVIDRRRWKVLGGGVLAVIGSVGVALAYNPFVLDQYRYALANPPSVNVTPTIGALLRLALDENQTWLQFVPTILGILWFPFYWIRQRQTWRWEDQAPLLLLVSFLTTAYGAWVFDIVILLLPLLQVAAGVIRDGHRQLVAFALVGYVAIDGASLAMNLMGATYPAFIWMTPAILLFYLALRRQLQR